MLFERNDDLYARDRSGLEREGVNGGGQSACAQRGLWRGERARRHGKVMGTE